MTIDNEWEEKSLLLEDYIDICGSEEKAFSALNGLVGVGIVSYNIVEGIITINHRSKGYVEIYIFTPAKFN